jgi:hypothetical protein
MDAREAQMREELLAAIKVLFAQLTYEEQEQIIKIVEQRNINSEC